MEVNFTSAVQEKLDQLVRETGVPASSLWKTQ